MIPINEISFDRVAEFNRLYLYCLSHFLEVKPTPSGAIPNGPSVKMHERFMVIQGNQRFELIAIAFFGCYRVVLVNKKPVDNCVSGSRATRIIYKKADQFGINLRPFASTPEEGFRIKQEIKQPHIQVMVKLLLRKKLQHVYHLDFKSSYASRIVEAYPELRPMYQELFDRRAENNGFFKHVLTNSIGCFQSRFCPDYTSDHRVTRYQFAKLSKAAVNGTREMVELYLAKLTEAGFVPLLTNTDGIWFYSPENKVFHDDREGQGLCCWEMDHSDCLFLMTSPGSYQYVENGKCHTVVRGKTALDAEEPDRDKWPFGAILDISDVITYRLVKGKGVVKDD